jgi:hypothetical protein
MISIIQIHLLSECEEWEKSRDIKKLPGNLFFFCVMLFYVIKLMVHRFKISAALAELF